MISWVQPLRSSVMFVWEPAAERGPGDTRYLYYILGPHDSALQLWTRVFFHVTQCPGFNIEILLLAV